jgi:hypothetical protein
MHLRADYTAMQRRMNKFKNTGKLDNVYYLAPRSSKRTFGHTVFFREAKRRSFRFYTPQKFVNVPTAQ